MSGFSFFDMLGQWSPLSPRVNWPPQYGYDASGGVIQPWMRDELVGGGGDDAPGQPPVVAGTGSGPGGMMTADEYKRSRAAEPPVPRSLAPDLYRPLDLRSTLPGGGGPAPPAAPAAAPPAGPGGVNAAISLLPPGTPAAARQPGVAPGLLGGNTNALMEALIRRQLQRSMEPDWGAMSGAFARAAMARAGLGAGIGLAAEAMSKGGGDKDALGSLKTLAEVQNLQSEQATRAAVQPAIAKFQEAYAKWAAGGKVGPPPTPPGGAGTSLAAGGALTGGDPRNKIPVIMAAFEKYGHDPAIGIQVARSEGLSTFLGDKGKSGGAFQLYTGGGLGNTFQQETGLDPLDPKNEDATIEWVAKNLDRFGWSPWHGAAKIGITGYTGIGSGARGGGGVPAQVAALPEVPGFTASMGGVRPTATEGSGSSSPYGNIDLVATDDSLGGGGGEDGGGGGLVTPPGGILGAAGRSAPIPGLMAQDRQPPPAPAAPPAAGPPAGASPYMPQSGPPPSALSYMPQNIPQPDTAATQALMAQLAALRASTVAAKIGDPFAAFETLLTQSPQYLREKIATEEAAKLPYAYMQPGANVRLQADLAAAKAQAEQLAKYLGPEANAKLQGEIAGAVEAGKLPSQIVKTAWDEWVKSQYGTPVEITVMDDGRKVTKKVTPQQFAQMQTGQAGPFLPGSGSPGAGTPAATTTTPARPGGMVTGGGGGFTPGQQVGTPVYEPGEKEEKTARGTALAKTYQEYRDAADLAANTKGTLWGVANDLNNVVKGPWANAAQTFASYARLLDPSFNQQVASYESAQSTVNELVRKAVRQSDPNPTFLQTKMAIESMPSPLQSEGGSTRIANRMIGLQNHDIARARAMQQWLDAPKNNGSLTGFDTHWRNSVSPITYMFLQMTPGDKNELAMRLKQTKQGEREIAKLQEQLQFIKQNGLEVQ